MSEPNRKFSLFPGPKDFRYRDIPPHELPEVLTLHIATGALGNTYFNLTTGMFLVAFGNAIGVSILEWGIFSAVSCFAVSIQLLSAFMAARYGYRRVIWYLSETTNRIMRGTAFALAFALFQYGHAAMAAAVLITLLCLASFFAAASAAPWFSWLADIVPEHIHGSFMGRRDAWMALVTLSIVLPASYGLDSVYDDFKPNVLVIIFAVGILLGVIDLIFHRHIPEPRLRGRTEGQFLPLVLAPWRNPEYRPWLIFSMLWNFSVMLAAGLCTVYFVEDLRIRDNFVGGSIVLIVLPLVGTLLTSAWSGMFIDRVGVKRVLIFAHLLWAVLPLFWVIATPANAIVWLGITFGVGGACCSAAVNAGNKLMTRVPPRGQRAMYIAVTGCLSNLGGGLGPLVGAVFLHLFQGQHWTMAGWQFVPFQVIFAASALFRLLVWMSLFRFRVPAFDPGTKDPPTLDSTPQNR